MFLDNTYKVKAHENQIKYGALQYVLPHQKSLVWNEYRKVDYIGGSMQKAGRFYDVYHYATQETRCMKIVDKDFKPESEIRMEIATLTALDHPNIIRLFEWFDSDNKYYIVMEFATGSDINKIVENVYNAGHRLHETWISHV